MPIKILPAIILLAAFVSCKTTPEVTPGDINAPSRKKIMSRLDSSRWDRQVNAIKDATRYYLVADPGFVNMVLIKASRDRHRPVRIEALKGLSALKSREGEQRIIEIIKTTTDSDEKWYALKALAFYEHAANSPLFVKALSSGDWLHREAAIMGILRISDLNHQRELVPYMIMAVNDPNNSVSMVTLRNLKIKDTRLYAAIVDKLNQALEKQNISQSMLLSVLTACTGYILDSATREKIIDLLAHPNYAIRLQAYRVLKTEQELIKTQ